ncbi:MAG: phosphoglycerate kinase [Bacteroidetes bacterium]|jgi:phosphoglycerate kinase|nr:phosphoglycerate kinase [Bacteroidota bacterium]MBK7041213.1 phosphoglycerate kinase [Bacteroidota bacterium]MBK7588592.1 phosphoglycerate kinase [Bacteroidota bacterium]MBK9302031.1 phosphoglycerate kinase [Bacteroidota bacterium]MBK9481596.1 phosphoglycerate kinase [Bacteroidota bacterium]
MSALSNFNFSGKKALIRVDFNVPLNAAFQITDDTRMRAAVPTIQKVLHDGGSVILMSHLGRPKEGPTDKYSLKHILHHLIKLLNGTTVKFASDCIGNEAVNDAETLQPGEVLLLENLRFYKEEEKGDVAFAKKLASLGDVYVNDAFGTAHRAHASTAVIAQFFEPAHKMFGLLMNAEVANAEKVMHDASTPFTAILGGAKVSDKILIIEMLLNKANNIIIGGGMAYTFLRAQGHPIGTSICEYDKLDLANELIKKAAEKGVKLFIPVDSVVADRFAADANTQIVDNDKIPDNWMGLDIGEKSITLFSEVIKNSKTILWNGPMGVFEMEKFQNGTKAIALAIAEATKQGAFSLIGGGDSVAAINQFDLVDQVSYVSTGGGALLEYFEGKVLPGIAAIRNV